MCVLLYTISGKFLKKGTLSNMKTLRYSVDRIEGELAILVPDEGKSVIELPVSRFGFKVNMILDVTFDGEKIVSIKEVSDEQDKRLAANKSRLRSLFAKNK